MTNSSPNQMAWRRRADTRIAAGVVAGAVAGAGVAALLLAALLLT